MQEITIGYITIKKQIQPSTGRMMSVFSVKDGVGYISAALFDDELSGKNLSYQLGMVYKAMYEMAKHTIGEASVNIE